MNSLRFAFGALLLVSAVGCNSRSNPGGGSERATRFDLAGPAMATSVKQGETQTVSIKVERGKDFKDTVALKAEPPAGIQAELGALSNKASEKGDVNLKVTVGEKAAVGENIIRVVGTPDTGSATTLDVKINVVARAENTRPETGNNASALSVHGPLFATTIKQGETTTVPLTVKQSSGGKYAGAVKLAVENPQRGIAAEFTRNSVKPVENSEVGLKIAVDKTADLGEHVLRIAGTADNGAVTPTTVHLKVVAP